MVRETDNNTAEVVLKRIVRFCKKKYNLKKSWQIVDMLLLFKSNRKFK
jgi:hypothetical protein